MIAPLVKKEILSNLLSYKFIVVFLMTILLTALSMGIMYRDFDARYADYMLIRPGAGDLIALTPPNPFSVLAEVTGSVAIKTAPNANPPSKKW